MMSSHWYEENIAPKLYFDTTFDIDAARILPGGYYATPGHMMLVTTLGSCVAACIRDPLNGVGGINHFMLPENVQEQGGWGSSSARYGSYAMEMLINQLLKMGAKRQNLEAKLFGGGAVIKHMKTINIGERNATFALDYLKTEGIPVVSTDLLDIYPRKICYFPQSGKVLVKKLYGLHNNEVLNREQDYRMLLKKSKVEGDVELFT
ncbi:chemoreceptor glutamine deamidase CheD [Methylobacter psychrophilus]|uniref:chemoreceptor glutamine deamidase CheD n=1 Tax=Methylobacter psychrophilus TaxID=96941 RepID=UPI0021D4DF99|nr:chemoreceptor glutamine deamidase CheD [Methylobacter psychrophilus]